MYSKKVITSYHDATLYESHTRDLEAFPRRSAYERGLEWTVAILSKRKNFLNM